MSNDFVELTQVKIVAGKLSDGYRKMVSLNHIFTVEPGAQNTTLLTLANGEKISVKETYNHLKAGFARVCLSRKNPETAPIEPLTVAAE